jgi:protein-disulfide isomerase
MSKKKDPVSKRQTIREKRRQQQQRQRLFTIIIITVVALVIVGLLVAPSIRNALTPVGTIVQITPNPRPMADGTNMGDPNAPVKIVVYEDFQCPACRNYSLNIEPLIVENYVKTGKVYYEFKQFPFLDRNNPGNESHQAANASLCAAAQGRFWDYHDILFANWLGENVGSFTDKRLVTFAENLGLNMDEFNACFNSNEFQNTINNDLSAGIAAGVNSTPSVFVNNQSVPISYDLISKAIDTALTSAGK